MEKAKRKRLSIFPINLKWLLVFVISLVCIIPLLSYGGVLVRSFYNTSIEDKKISLQSQAAIIADNIGTSSYLDIKDETDINAIQINASIENLANVFSGRILVINKDYRIIKDTFEISKGSFHVAKEVVKCFRGENTNLYNDKKNYIIQTLPIYGVQITANSGTDIGNEELKNRNVEGVLLIYSSTRGNLSILENTKDKILMLNIIMCLILFAISLFIASSIVRPLNQLKDSIVVASEGVLDDVIDVKQYSLTKKISEAINSIFKKLKDMNNLRDEFVANVSHELKTPITSIRVLADSLMTSEGVTLEQYKEFMTDISNEIDRESKIIDDLLSLVKLDKAKVDLVTSQININSLIEQIIKRLKPIADKRKIEIEFESIRVVEAEVEETKLSLAISNLVENAIKYNKDEGFIKILLDADHKFFYLKVIDSGVGIPEELQEAIFERFYRVDKARSRETGGTGLGLAIAKNIVLRHKGIINVTSKEGEGSTFLIRIPLTYRKKKS